MEQDNTLNLEDFGILPNRGFLPKEDPLTELPSHFRYLDDFGRDIPGLIASGNIIARARELLIPSIHALNGLSQAERNRARMIYEFAASGCIHPTKPSQTLLVKEIAKPLCWLSEKFGKPPILSYCSYALTNWAMKNPDGYIEADNLKLLQNFIDVYDEDWFILVHVDIEKSGSDVVRGGTSAVNFADKKNLPSVFMSLEMVQNGLGRMIRTLNRMPEHCSTEVYYREVRPWINYFKDVVYEGISDTPQSYRGETGAQSSIMPFLSGVLGIKYKESVLTKHLDTMRLYMPPGHRRLIEETERLSKVREYILNSNSRYLRDAYNGCLEKMIEFRDIHYGYATSYIHNKTNDPHGTGGTVFMEWLKQMRDDTTSAFIT